MIQSPAGSVAAGGSRFSPIADYADVRGRASAVAKAMRIGLIA